MPSKLVVDEFDLVLELVIGQFADVFVDDVFVDDVFVDDVFVDDIFVDDVFGFGFGFEYMFGHRLESNNHELYNESMLVRI